MGTLLEAIGIVLETHFGFGFPNGSPIGDSLSTLQIGIHENLKERVSDET